MGMDTVELVMDVERKFDIRIPDQAAERIFTIGDLHDFVVKATSEREPPLSSTKVWNSISRILVENYGIAPGKIKREAQIVRDLGLD